MQKIITFCSIIKSYCKFKNVLCEMLFKYGNLKKIDLMTNQPHYYKKG